jgi:hypothetical protein
LIAAANTASIENPAAPSGAALGSGADMESPADAASTDKQTRAEGSGGNSSPRGMIYTLGFWLSILFAALALLSIAIWIVVKLTRKTEPSQNGDVIYKSLQDARQIYGRMIK